MSTKDSLTKEDIKKAAINLLIFSKPAVTAGGLAFLISLSGDKQLTLLSVTAAAAMGLHACFNFLTDLVIKYKAGPEVLEELAKLKELPATVATAN